MTGRDLVMLDLCIHTYLPHITYIVVDVVVVCRYTGWGTGRTGVQFYTAGTEEA
jgi:hypothetical protein